MRFVREARSLSSRIYQLVRINREPTGGMSRRSGL